MTKKTRKRTRRNPWDDLSKYEIAKRWPYKVPIIEHLIVSQRKLKHLAAVLEALKMKVRATSDGSWFDIVEA